MKLWSDVEREWEKEHGPDGSWQETLDLVLGWGVPLLVLGLAGWKVLDLAAAGLRLLR